MVGAFAVVFRAFWAEAFGAVVFSALVFTVVAFVFTVVAFVFAAAPHEVAHAQKQQRAAHHFLGGAELIEAGGYLVAGVFEGGGQLAEHFGHTALGEPLLGLAEQGGRGPRGRSGRRGVGVVHAEKGKGW